ncbi:hypothetical protein J1N35_001650, partial [Gossypium stocksii]
LWIGRIPYAILGGIRIWINSLDPHVRFKVQFDIRFARAVAPEDPHISFAL